MFPDLSSAIDGLHVPIDGAALTEVLVLRDRFEARIVEANPAEGYLMESLMSAVATGSAEAKDRMRAFLQRKSGRVGRD